MELGLPNALRLSCPSGQRSRALIIPEFAARARTSTSRTTAPTGWPQALVRWRPRTVRSRRSYPAYGSRSPSSTAPTCVGGGCTILAGQPDWLCRQCRHRWFDATDPVRQEIDELLLALMLGAEMPSNSESRCVAGDLPRRSCVSPPAAHLQSVCLHSSCQPRSHGCGAERRPLHAVVRGLLDLVLHELGRLVRIPRGGHSCRTSACRSAARLTAF